MFGRPLLSLCVAVALCACATALDLQCTIPSPPPPATDVNHLHPSDFKMLFSAGDSITAGFAMHGKPTEYRKDVYAIGANKDSNTLFTYLQLYNPQLVGGSTEDTLPIDAGVNPEVWLDLESSKTQLNGAISGAVASGVHSQVSYLANQQKKYDTVNWKTDWKLFTLLIGANDLCGSCYHNGTQSAQDFGQNINQIVAQIYSSIPRVAVQLVGLFNISQVWDINRRSLYCETVDKTFDECGCLYDSRQTRQQMDENTLLYNAQLRQVAANWQAMGLSDFTVVYQPCFENTILTSDKYLSSLDCFHPSWETDELMANGLWNCMWLPSDQKPHQTEPGVVPMCPTADTVFATS